MSATVTAIATQAQRRVIRDMILNGVDTNMISSMFRAIYGASSLPKRLTPERIMMLISRNQIPDSWWDDDMICLAGHVAPGKLSKPTQDAMIKHEVMGLYGRWRRTEGL